MLDVASKKLVGYLITIGIIVVIAGVFAMARNSEFSSVKQPTPQSPAENTGSALLVSLGSPEPVVCYGSKFKRLREKCPSGSAPVCLVCTLSEPPICSHICQPIYYPGPNRSAAWRNLELCLPGQQLRDFIVSEFQSF